MFLKRTLRILFGKTLDETIKFVGICLLLWFLNDYIISIALSLVGITYKNSDKYLSFFDAIIFFVHLFYLTFIIRFMQSLGVSFVERFLTEKLNHIECSQVMFYMNLPNMARNLTIERRFLILSQFTDLIGDFTSENNQRQRIYMQQYPKLDPGYIVFFKGLYNKIGTYLNVVCLLFLKRCLCVSNLNLHGLLGKKNKKKVRKHSSDWLVLVLCLCRVFLFTFCHKLNENVL